MPIYEYECSNCGNRLEVLQRMSDDPLTDCPECETPALTKLISAAAFHLKGTGWYATDFKNSGKPAKDAKKGNGEDTATGDTAAKKSEDKSESKSESKSKSDAKSEAA